MYVWVTVTLLVNFCTISIGADSKCPMNCLNYYDGCNWCTCDPASGLSSCTERACLNEAKEKAKCLECESNLEWTTCGSTCWSETNCDNKNGVPCTLQCVSQCQCPPNMPIFNQQYGECVTENECGLLKCPKYCVGEYYNGCNTCQCNPETGYAENCDDIHCFTLNDPECKQCKNKNRR